MAKKTTGSDLLETVEEERTQAASTVHSLREAAGQLGEYFKVEGRDLAERKREAMALHLVTAKEAVLDAAERLSQNGDGLVAKPLAHLANATTEFASYLETTPVQEICSDAADFVRRHPLACFGTALAAGLMAGRLLGSTTPKD